MQRNQPRFDAESRTVLINLPGEKKLEDEVAAQLERQGYRVIVMESGQAVEAWLLSERPLAVVLAELPEKEGLYCEAMDELNRSGNCPFNFDFCTR
ncbi:response regulator transcription factor [Candidatus Reidiella endopervernicosa]|uniref:Response regulator transcription factor n=1 Tax=Candidatus Reidiella endopervernicosa TaxID=2738883 RepID=A0A6N0HR98_9GAMM|nr:response regulator transcription factor [Candidatus Reidiella endopervernicosa]QKQ24939.1 response regulator transcription factor [Candidatus Reidiella endopervernicosa]